jgi:hypothetical protein
MIVYETAGAWIRLTMTPHTIDPEAPASKRQKELACDPDGDWKIKMSPLIVFGKESERDDCNEEEECRNDEDRETKPTKEDDEKENLDDAIADGARGRDVASAVRGVVDCRELRLRLQGGVFPRKAMHKHLTTKGLEKVEPFVRGARRSGDRTHRRERMG